MTELKNSKIFIYTFVIFFSFFIRFYLFEDRNSWHDEWHSIYVSDPNVSFKQTIERYLGNKGDSFLTEFYLISKKFFLKPTYEFSAPLSPHEAARLENKIVKMGEFNLPKKKN